MRVYKLKGWRLDGIKQTYDIGMRTKNERNLITCIKILHSDLSMQTNKKLFIQDMGEKSIENLEYNINYIEKLIAKIERRLCEQ